MTCGGRRATAVGLTVLFLAFPVATSHAATADSLAHKLQQAGVGCLDAKSFDYDYWNGTKVRCTIDGTDIAIETYGPGKFKQGMRFACGMGITGAVLTDGRSWTIGFMTSSTQAKVRAVVGGRVRGICQMART